MDGGDADPASFFHYLGQAAQKAAPRRRKSLPLLKAEYLAERNAAWEESTALYRRGIELDPLSEEFHRRLMQSYHAQGRLAEALDAYRRCRDLLSITARRAAFRRHPGGVSRAEFVARIPAPGLGAPCGSNRGGEIFAPLHATMPRYLYVPPSCTAAGPHCRVHVAIHGCAQSAQSVKERFYTKTGYNNWADNNNILVLYPQVDKSPFNPEGCWDWWGYTGANYANKSSPQMKAITAMVKRLAQHRSRPDFGAESDGSDPQQQQQRRGR